jgi:acyl carrier protein
MALEDEFDIEIDDDDAYTFEKVGDIYNYFIKKDIGVE